ncbi:glycosyltransferase family 4 protein [Robbsia sp. KACC 23696]|uniref:glycosyltransferase family 4 protein n=1 Tax=Robbsia sp. KACC 23696 TaxID=3149231 RepID=UPI00325B8D19
MPTTPNTPTSASDDDRKKILVLDQSGVMGGAELSLLEVCKRIRSACNVVLFTDGPFRERLQEAGVAVSILGDSTLNNMKKDGGRALSFGTVKSALNLSWQLVKQARSRRLVYANTQKAMVIGAVVGFLARRPVVWHLRDIVSPDHFGADRLRVIQWCSKLFLTHVIANSKASADAWLALTKLPRDRVSVVYNGIDAAPFDVVNATPRAELRARFGLPADAFLVGTFSRLAQWKGQHVLLDAIAKTPNAHAVLVGAALFGEDAYEAQLKAQAQKLGIAHRVHFLGFQRDVPAAMSAMDVIAHTSIAPEPFGRVIVEAMLARRPIVAAAAGGALEIITPEQDGILIEPNRADLLAEQIEKLRTTPEVAHGLIERGYASARARFDPDVYCHNVMKKLEVVGGFMLPEDPLPAATSIAAQTAHLAATSGSGSAVATEGVTLRGATFAPNGGQPVRPAAQVASVDMPASSGVSSPAAPGTTAEAASAATRQ